MIHFQNKELDEVSIKLLKNENIKVKESRIATFGLSQF